LNVDSVVETNITAWYIEDLHVKWCGSNIRGRVWRQRWGISNRRWGSVDPSAAAAPNF